MTENTFSPRHGVSEHVQRRATELMRGYHGTGSASNESAARAELAALRASLTGPVGRDPLAYKAMFDGIDERLIGHGHEPSRAEFAIATSLGLFGLHQQGGREFSAHQPGIPLGAALRRLARPDDAADREKPTMRRFSALVTSTTNEELVRHITGLIRQFRSADIGLDYGRLAADLYDFASPATRDRARLRWSRDAIARASRPADIATETSHA